MLHQWVRVREGSASGDCVISTTYAYLSTANETDRDWKGLERPDWDHILAAGRVRALQKQS